MKVTELLASSALAQAKAILDGKISALGLMQWYILLTRELNASLFAFEAIDEERLSHLAKLSDAKLAEAKANGSLDQLGKLHGVPFAMKGNIAMKDFVTFAGSEYCKHKNRLSDKNATLVDRLENAGAIAFAHTTLPPYSLNYSDKAQNPYNLKKGTGGSSSGPAAAAAGMGPSINGANDGSGSIIYPAALCGLVGFRPTPASVPTTGIGPSSSDTDYVSGLSENWFTMGLIARYVADVRSAFLEITGPDEIDPRSQTEQRLIPAIENIKGLRIGYYLSDGKHKVDSAISTAIKKVAKRLKNKEGAIIEEACPEGVAHAWDKIGQIFYYQTHAGFIKEAKEREENNEEILPKGAKSYLALMDGNPDAASIQQAETAFTELKNTIADYFTKHDVYICPAVGFTSLPKGRDLSERQYRGNLNYLFAPNLLGLPSVVVRVGTNPVDHMPISIRIVAQKWQDLSALFLAEIIEKHFGGYQIPKLVKKSSTWKMAETTLLD